jgi:hypothetical protein
MSQLRRDVLFCDAYPNAGIAEPLLAGNEVMTSPLYGTLHLQAIYISSNLRMTVTMNLQYIPY